MENKLRQKTEPASDHSMSSDHEVNDIQNLAPDNDLDVSVVKVDENNYEGEEARF